MKSSRNDEHKEMITHYEAVLLDLERQKAEAVEKVEPLRKAKTEKESRQREAELLHKALTLLSDHSTWLNDAKDIIRLQNDLNATTLQAVQIWTEFWDRHPDYDSEALGTSEM